MINIGLVRMTYIKFYQSTTIRGAYAIGNVSMTHHYTELQEALEKLRQHAKGLEVEGVPDVEHRNICGKYLPKCSVHVRALIQYIEDQIVICSKVLEVLHGIPCNPDVLEIMKVTRRIDALEITDYQQFEVEKRVQEHLLNQEKGYDHKIEW